MPSTFTRLLYHIVFGTKYRQPLLVDNVRDALHAYLGGCIRTVGGVPIEIGGVADHVHILARLKATHSVSDVLRSIKRGSSEWLRSHIRQFYWQDGYSAFTVSPSDEEAKRIYIRGQEEHHRVKTFEDEYRELLREHGIEFDEKYLL